MDIKLFTDYHQKVIHNCSKVIIGKEKVISLILICFVCSGHVLLEDVPGTGKTMLLRAFSKTVGGNFRRIQFTPDLLPSDLTGLHIYNQKSNEFEFRPGPIFTNIVLADEINRATPRTQSSLLEAMEERQITIDGKTFFLSEPFMIMATQNPVESYGTFPLPEAQADRFFMRLSLGYMTRDQECTVIKRKSTVEIINSLKKVVSSEETEYIKENFHNVEVSSDVIDYIMDIVSATREKNKFVTGVSTRGSVALYKAAQVYAAFCGRSFVIPEDVAYVAPHVLSHRLVAGASSSKEDAQNFISNLIEQTPVPLEKI